MCKKNNPRKIDECMKPFLQNLQWMLHKDYEVVASCCGHGRYERTVVIKDLNYKDNYFELISNQGIPRIKRFYKKDSKGYYYIPEVNVVKKLQM